MEIEDINFKGILVKEGNHTILHNLSGTFKKKRLTAILGASGSGKTTLLETMSGRRECKDKQVSMGHHNLSSSALRAIVSLLKHDDPLPMHETIKEALNLNADLRNIKYNIDKELEYLNIGDKKDCLIHKLSSGEQKRVSIALELIHNPALVYLDEPLTGLDAYSALKTLKYIKKLCESRTIVLTVHQPSSAMLHEFDDILVLKKGRIVFYGTGDQLFEFYKTNNLECPKHFNPFEHLFFSVLPNIPEPPVLEVVAEKNEENVKLHFEANIIFKDNMPPMLYQTRLLLLRNVRNVLRRNFEFHTFAISAVFAVFISLLFYNYEVTNSEVMDFNIHGFFSIISITLIFFPSIWALSSAFCSKRLFLKEYLNGNYSLTAYFIAKESVEMFLLGIHAIVFWIALFVVLGGKYSFGGYVLTFSYFLISMIIGHCIGIIASYAFVDLRVASSVLNGVILFFSVLNGSFITLPDSSYIWFLHYLSPFWYIYNGLGLSYSKPELSYYRLSSFSNIFCLFIIAVLLYACAFGVISVKYGGLIKRQN